MTDLENAKERLLDGGYTCVLCCASVYYMSQKAGISPLLDWLTDGTDFRGFSAADKLVGKAAALLFARGGAREVFASVMSEAALPVLQKYGIGATYETLVPYIVNRQGDGACPMEQTVAGIEDPELALEALLKTRAALMAGKKEDTH